MEGGLKVLYLMRLFPEIEEHIKKIRDREQRLL